MSSRLEGLAGLLNSTAPIATDSAVKAASVAVGSLPVLIEISKIKRSPYQPRRFFNKTKITAMAEKFAKYRERNEYPRTAILVRPVGENYELVFGEQRKLAHEQAGFEKLFAFVDASLTDEESSELALDENLMREDLNPFERTQAILARAALLLKSTPEAVKQLLDRAAREQKQGLNIAVQTKEWQQLEAFFKSLPEPITPDSFRSNHLPILNLPEAVLEQVQKGSLEYTKAKVIAGVTDEALRQQLLQESVEQNLSIRAIRDRAKLLKQTAPEPAESTVPTLRSRFDATYQRAKKSKQLWNNPQKSEKIEWLLNQLDALMDEDSR